MENFNYIDYNNRIKEDVKFDTKTNKDVKQSDFYKIISNSSCLEESFLIKNKSLNNKEVKYKRSFIDQPINDKRNISLFTFLSGFEILIISDERVEKYSSAMNVKIGSLLDPLELQGLAHFVEHMLFMGTDKYPVENDFDSFLSKNSGYSNAFTENTNTCYHFEVVKKGFEGALDRFSRFFIDPLFIESSVKREIKAVNSEFNNTKSNDSWRINQISISELNDKSILNKFTIGNTKSIEKAAKKKNLNLRNEAYKFYKKYYKPSVMTLVVLSNLNLEEMKNICFNYFYELFEDNNSNNNNYIKPKVSTEEYLSIIDINFDYQMNNYNIYNTYLEDVLNLDNKKYLPYIKEKNINKIYFIKPISSSKEIIFEWVIYDNHTDLYKNSPLKFINRLIGHEGKYSITNELKELDLITDLCSSYSDVSRVCSLFNITISLTNKGLDNWINILAYIYKYINMLCVNDINIRYYNEVRKQAWLSFTFNDIIGSPGDYVESIASLFTHFKSKEVLTCDYLFTDEINDNIVNNIKKYLLYLKYDNMNIYFITKDKNINLINKNESDNLLNKDFDYKYYEPHYKVKYHKIDIHNSILKELTEYLEKIDNNVFKYPEINTFIAENIDIKCLSNNITTSNNISNNLLHPYIIKENSYSSVWFKQDTHYKYPKIFVVLRMWFDSTNLDYIKFINLGNIILDLINDELTDLTYLAGEAEIGVSTKLNENGLTVYIKGFSDKIYYFTNTYFNNLKLLYTQLYIKLNSKSYLLTKLITKIEEYLRDKKIQLTSKPYKQASYLLSLMLYERSSYIQQDIDYLEKIYNNKMNYDDESNEDDSCMSSSEEDDDSKSNNKTSDDEESEDSHNKENKSINNDDNKISTKELKEPLTQDIKYILLEMFNKIRFLWHIQGNINKEDAIEIVDTAEQHIKELFYINDSTKTSISNNITHIHSQYNHINSINISSNNSIKITSQYSENNVNKDLNNNQITPLIKSKVLNIIENNSKISEYSYYLNNYDKEDKNYSLLSYIELGNLNLIESVSLNILINILSEMFFNKIRTIDQVGYYVSCYLSKVKDIQGIIFVAQSSKFTTEQMYDKFEDFINETYIYLKDETNEEFYQTYIQAMIDDLKVNFVNLKTEFAYYWNLIYEEKHHEFDYTEKKIKILSEGKITKNNIVNTMNKIINKDSLIKERENKSKEINLNLLENSYCRKRLDINIVPNKYDYINNNSKINDKKNENTDYSFLRNKRVLVKSIEEFKSLNKYNI